MPRWKRSPRGTSPKPTLEWEEAWRPTASLTWSLATIAELNKEEEEDAPVTDAAIYGSLCGDLRSGVAAFLTIDLWTVVDLCFGLNR